MSLGKEPIIKGSSRNILQQKLLSAIYIYIKLSSFPFPIFLCVLELLTQNLPWYRIETLDENGLSMLERFAKLSDILGATKSSTKITRRNNEWFETSMIFFRVFSSSIFMASSVIWSYYQNALKKKLRRTSWTAMTHWAELVDLIIFFEIVPMCPESHYALFSTNTGLLIYSS